MRIAWLLLLTIGCGGATPAPRAPVAQKPILVASAVADSGFDTLEIAPPKPAPRHVLHAGDSFVGGCCGLRAALERHFRKQGARFDADWWTSITIEGYARTPRFAELIQKHNPDLVILTLGANDMFAGVPKSLAPMVRSIAKKTQGRECWWITPPRWSIAPPTGIIEVIKENAAPCKVFDSTPIAKEIDRAYDHIHPSDEGGVTWANLFLESYYARTKE